MNYLQDQSLSSLRIHAWNEAAGKIAVYMLSFCKIIKGRIRIVILIVTVN